VPYIGPVTGDPGAPNRPGLGRPTTNCQTSGTGGGGDSGAGGGGGGDGLVFGSIAGALGLPSGVAARAGVAKALSGRGTSPTLASALALALGFRELAARSAAGMTAEAHSSARAAVAPAFRIESPKPR
jgi:hypothetical protein